MAGCESDGLCRYEYDICKVSCTRLILILKIRAHCVGGLRTLNQPIRRFTHLHVSQICYENVYETNEKQCPERHYHAFHPAYQAPASSKPGLNS